MPHLHFSSPSLNAQQVAQSLAMLGLPTLPFNIQNGHARIALPPTPELNTEALRPKLLGVARQLGCDIALLDSSRNVQHFKVLAMDMDSTLITIECIDEIADFAGKKKEVSEITEAAMRGEIKDFSESLTRRVALLKGVPASSLNAVLQERLALSPGAESLIAFAKRHGWTTLLVSGGFTFFTEAMKARLGLDHAHSNTLEIVDGVLTGRVLGAIVDAQAKQDHLLALCKQLGCSPDQAIAMGDGANDLKMMGVAGLSVAYRAKPAVQSQTHCAINHGGLDTVCAWLG